MTIPNGMSDRITLVELSAALSHGYPEDSIEKLIAGLSAAQKSVPPEFSYDDKGSAYFDRFVETPEYYLPKKEIEIFHTHKNELVDLTGDCAIFEVGAGSSKKTRILLEAYDRRYDRVDFYPIDINLSIMLMGAQETIKLLPNVHIHCIAGAYSDVFSQSLPSFQEKTIGTKRSLFLLIGSSISQEENDDLLISIRRQLAPDDLLLICFDLQKDPQILRSAYQNYEGSMCSLNVLSHLNETFGSSFETGDFKFEVQYNPDHGGCETHLRSKVEQTVKFEALDLTVELREGETIRTGTQRKFGLEQMRQRLEGLGFGEVRTFFDQAHWYAAMLLEAR